MDSLGNPGKYALQRGFMRAYSSRDEQKDRLHYTSHPAKKEEK